jgi:hypothetical protein
VIDTPPEPTVPLPRTIVLPQPKSFDDTKATAVLMSEWFTWLFPPDQVVELRALHVRPGTGGTHTEAGYFDGDHRQCLADAALRVTPRAQGVYATLNPCNPALLARRKNRTDWAKEGDLTKNNEILSRRWLLVDIDPVRPSGISATDAEKAAASDVIVAVRDALRARDWPEPILADSGNGYHLYYRVDLPVDDDDLVKNVLEVLAGRFDTVRAKVDKTVHNAARIVKLPGTLSRKGDATDDRPHRRSRMLEVPALGRPEDVGVVPRERLEALVAEFSTASGKGNRSTGRKKKRGSKGLPSRLDVGRWLRDRNVGFQVKRESDDHGRTIYVLATCPFDPSHTSPDASVMQREDGQLSAHCFHNSCSDNGWEEFKKQIGAPAADHYDPPLQSRSKAKRKSSAETSSPDSPAPSGGPATAAPSAKGGAGTAENSERDTIAIDEHNVPVDSTIRAIKQTLLQSGQYYVRAGQLVRVTGDVIVPVLKAQELIGSVNALAEVACLDDEGTPLYKPLPLNYASTWMHRPDLTDQFPKITLFCRTPVYTPDWRLASAGYDPASGYYCAAPRITPADGTARIDALLKDFCFQTPGDRTNYLAFLLTVLLIPRYIGSKPAGLFNGNQPELGKSMLAQILSILRDGRQTETVTYTSNDEEFEKRLGAVVRNGSTTIIVDNAKATGRCPRIESACLERAITDPITSFRLLGYSSTIRTENSLFYIITANTPQVGPDIMKRSVAVRLHYEGNPTRRQFTIPDVEGYAEEYRVELLGELAGMIERWLVAGKPEADARIRFNKKGWGRTIGGILAVNGRPDFLSNVEQSADLDDVRREFTVLVGIMADHGDARWTATELVDLVRQERLFESQFRAQTPRSQVTRMGIIAGHYVDESFPLSEDRIATFRKRDDRKGTVYAVTISDAYATD